MPISHKENMMFHQDERAKVAVKLLLIQVKTMFPPPKDVLDTDIVPYAPQKPLNTKAFAIA